VKILEMAQSIWVGAFKVSRAGKKESVLAAEQDSVTMIGLKLKIVLQYICDDLCKVGDH